MKHAGMEWSSRDCNTSVWQLFQVDGEGYLDPEKTAIFVKANNPWGPVLADNDSLISKCVAFANSFSRGKFNFFIV